MDLWLVWLIVMGLLAIGEIVTLTLVSGMLAIGAGAASIAAALGGNALVSMGVFGVVSLGMLAVVRPIAKRHRHQPIELRTGIDALLGADAIVLEQVTPRDGRVKLAGEVWSARSMGDYEFAPGTVVQVLQIDGATAVVG